MLSVLLFNQEHVDAILMALMRLGFVAQRFDWRSLNQLQNTHNDQSEEPKVA